MQLYSRNGKYCVSFCLAALLVWNIRYFTDIHKTTIDFRSFFEDKSSIVCTDKHALPKDKRLFQSTAEIEFPTVRDIQFRIPHIIHQIYTDDNVPHILAPMIQSFVTHNPTWTYMFWSYETGRTLIKKTHPNLLDAYDSFTSHHAVMKVDVLRWVILYEFGGLYADMDVVNLRPLDITTKKYACIVPTEPFEHAAIYDRTFILSTAVILCRPKHPFIQFLLDHLVKANNKGNPVAVTGPGFITRMFKAYNRLYGNNKHSVKTDLSSNSPTFYKGILLETDNDAVYVPNSQYFMDTLSPERHTTMENICIDKTNETLSDLLKRACFEFSSRKQIRQNRKFTFTQHYWLHLWTYHSRVLDSLRTVPIHYIVPGRKVY